MSTQTGKISIQFIKNKKGNLQQKKISIAGSDNQVHNFDSIPDKKNFLKRKFQFLYCVRLPASGKKVDKLGMLNSSWMNSSRS